MPASVVHAAAAARRYVEREACRDDSDELREHARLGHHGDHAGVTNGSISDGSDDEGDVDEDDYDYEDGFIVADDDDDDEADEADDSDGAAIARRVSCRDALDEADRDARYTSGSGKRLVRPFASAAVIDSSDDDDDADAKDHAETATKRVRVEEPSSQAVSPALRAAQNKTVAQQTTMKASTGTTSTATNAKTAKKSSPPMTSANAAFTAKKSTASLGAHKTPPSPASSSYSLFWRASIADYDDLVRAVKAAHVVASYETRDKNPLLWMRLCRSQVTDSATPSSARSSSNGSHGGGNSGGGRHTLQLLTMDSREHALLLYPLALRSDAAAFAPSDIDNRVAFTQLLRVGSEQLKSLVLKAERGDGAVIRVANVIASDRNTGGENNSASSSKPLCLELHAPVRSENADAKHHSSTQSPPSVVRVGSCTATRGGGSGIIQQRQRTLTQIATVGVEGQAAYSTPVDLAAWMRVCTSASAKAASGQLRIRFTARAHSWELRMEVVPKIACGESATAAEVIDGSFGDSHDGDGDGSVDAGEDAVQEVLDGTYACRHVLEVTKIMLAGSLGGGAAKKTAQSSANDTSVTLHLYRDGDDDEGSHSTAQQPQTVLLVTFGKPSDDVLPRPTLLLLPV